MPYYAVVEGRNPGIYTSWDECSAQVNRFSGAIYRKFLTKCEAEDFLETRSSSSSRNDRSVAFSGYDVVQSKTFYDGYNQYSQSSFDIDEDGYVNVYTDGACTSNGYKNARAAIGVWFGDYHPLNLSLPVTGRATNNYAEIFAATMAGKQAKKAGIRKLKINADSEFLINCVTKWMPKWKRREWRTADNRPVLNKTELLEMERELASLLVEWKHVKGHNGNYGNDMADTLARSALQ